MLCRDRCGYCTFAKPPAAARRAVPRPRRRARDRPSRSRDGLPRGAVHAGRGARGALPRRRRVARRARVLLHRRLPGRGGAGGPRRDRPPPPRQRRCAHRGRAHPAAGREPVPGDDDRDPGCPPRRARAARTSVRPTRPPNAGWPRSRPRAGPGCPSPPASSSASARPATSGSTRCSPSAPAHERHGHVQEVIVQNFLPKPGTAMHKDAACPPDEFLWTVAAARLVLGGGDAPPGAAQPLRRPRCARGRRDRRLGRGLPRHARPRQPGTALARPRPPPRRHRGRRQGARPAPHRVPGVRARPGDLAAPRRAHPGVARVRPRGPRPRRHVGFGRRRAPAHR